MSASALRAAAQIIPLRPAEAEREPSRFGEPVVIRNSLGLLYPGNAGIAVLMLGAVGYEEMCLRTTWRALAEGLSKAGIANLRFDWPGQGDAPEAEDVEGLADWFETIRAAAERLRRESGCSRLVLVGQGLGGMLALHAAQAAQPLAGTVLMAPVANGKRYQRELSVWSRMVCDRIGIGVDPDDDTACAVAGIRIAPGRLHAIAGLKADAVTTAPSDEVLLVARPGHGADDAVEAALAGLGCRVTRQPYEGYEVLTTDPTAARPPRGTLAAIVRWVAERDAAPSSPGHRQVASLARPPFGEEVLRGEGFVERPFRFGPDGRLLGILCEPAGGVAEGDPVLFVNAGRDYHIGWARVTVNQARAFARRGVASLRFDCSGIGDSPAASDGPEEILYSQAQIEDVSLAIDALTARGFAPPVVVGRCSGAYAAFNAAVADARVRRLVMVNNERFVWDPDESVEDAIRYAHRSVGDFGATLRRKGGLRRLFTGQLRVGPAARYILFRWHKQVSVALAPFLGRLTKHGRLHRECHRRMAVLAGRSAEISLVYAEGDVGMGEFRTYFGARGERLASYPEASLTMIPDADHNFTHRAAADRLLAVLTRLVAP